jgi:hypothetical protein
MIDGLNHVGEDHNCSVCQTEFTDDEGGMLGFIGIIPVAFCPFCFAGICDMVEQMDDREWEGLTDEEIDKICGDVGYGYIDVARAIEDKLKEKNTYD